MRRHTFARFPVFFALNLVASYLPGLLWVPFSPGHGVGLKLLLSPAILPLLLLGPSNLLACLLFLALYVLAVAGLSTVSCRIRWFAWACPFFLFFAVLFQGLIVLLLVYLDWQGNV